jgi:hypothetical protein
VTLPVEIYTSLREREFDEAEAELAAAMALREQARPQAASRPAKASQRRTAR